ncbi:MAG: serine hydrolase domain-containing protein [Anaerolineae bacterium]
MTIPGRSTSGFHACAVLRGDGAWTRFLDPAQHFRYEYSNLGYGILGRVITNVAGMPYQQYIRQNILVPLGMTSSTYDVHQVDPARLAMGYRRLGDQWVADPPPGRWRIRLDGWSVHDDQRFLALYGVPALRVSAPRRRRNRTDPTQFGTGDAAALAPAISGVGARPRTPLPLPERGPALRAGVRRRFAG